VAHRRETISLSLSPARLSFSFFSFFDRRKPRADEPTKLRDEEREVKEEEDAERERKRESFLFTFFQTLSPGKKRRSATARSKNAFKRERKKGNDTSCNLKTNASMRSSMVPV